MCFSNFTILFVLISWIIQSSLILSSPVQSKAKRSDEKVCANLTCPPGQGCCTDRSLDVCDNFGPCIPCGDCAECINCNITTAMPTSTPTPSEMSTTPATPTPTTSGKSPTPAGTTGLSTASQTSMITSTSVPNIDKQKEGSLWKSIYLLPIIGVPCKAISLTNCSLPYKFKFKIVFFAIN
ncbi:uncharacterized protein [Antedon mediterranea]|uniref:uncharacterized protein n=1 Tax=Antedon mediterranea TaxID=105859 RepID=UPI003AF5D958